MVANGQNVQDLLQQTAQVISMACPLSFVLVCEDDPGRESISDCIDALITTYRADVLIESSYVRYSISWGDQCAYPAPGHTMANKESDQCSYVKGRSHISRPNVAKVYAELYVYNEYDEVMVIRLLGQISNVLLVFHGSSIMFCPD